MTSENAPMAAPVAVPPTTATPEELYRTAYEDYMRGNYDLAAQGISPVPQTLARHRPRRQRALLDR